MTSGYSVGPAGAPGASRSSNPDLEAARAARASEPSDDLVVSVIGRLFRLAPRLMELQELGARQYGLGFARGRALWALRESGPVLMRTLSQALGVSPRTVTDLVDALEADGWVTRSPHPTDRRATIIALTTSAEAVLARLDLSYRSLAYALVGDVAPADLRRMRAVIGQLEDRLDESVAKSVATFEAGSSAPLPGRTGGRPPAPGGRQRRVAD